MEKKDVKILIIEDDMMLNKIYQTKLGMLGYQVIASYDGEDGLQKIETENPNIVLLDLMLPKKNGFEVLGAVDFLVKSNVKLETVINRIEGILQKYTQGV